jgi:hypothetical protein
MFTQAIDALQFQAATVEGQIAQLQEKLSQIQSQIQAVQSVEQAAKSAIAQVKQAIAGIRAIDASLEDSFHQEVEACFSPSTVTTPILLEAGDDNNEDEDLSPQPSPDAGDDFVIAEAIGEIEIEVLQSEDEEILPDLRDWTAAELRKAIESLGLPAPKKGGTKLALIQIIGKAHGSNQVSKDEILEALSQK